jgi:hypothetical protein
MRALAPAARNAVTVGFDYGTDGDAFAYVLLYGVEIFSQCGERDFGPSPAVENQRAALGYPRQIETRCVHLADYSDGTHCAVSCR